MSATATAAGLLATFRRSRRDLLDMVRSFDDAQKTAPEPPGGWPARNALILIAAWLHEASERIPALMAGAPARAYEIDAFNAAALTAAADWTPEQATGAFKRAADRFEALASELTDDILDEEPDVRAWLESAARVMICSRIDELRKAAASRH